MNEEVWGELIDRISIGFADLLEELRRLDKKVNTLEERIGKLEMFLMNLEGGRNDKK